MNNCVKRRQIYFPAAAFLVILLFLLPACGDEEPAQKAGEARAVPVRTAQVEARNFSETAEGIGSLSSPENVKIEPEIGAILQEVHFQEGARVEKGELLFTLEARQLQSELRASRAALESARAALENTRSTFQRYEKLYERDIISEDEFEQRRTSFRTARSEVDRLEAQLQTMRERLDETEIYAPMTGVLSERNADPGDYVAPGDILVSIYTLDPLEISFRVGESFMGRVEPGQAVNVHLSSGKVPPCKGEVIFVGPSIEPETRKFLVKASVCNPEGRLKPGAFARAEIILDVRKDSPAVPEGALVSEREGYSLFMIEQGKAVRREVEIGLRKPGLVEIADGASVGEEVVVEGQLQLNDGDKVEVTNQTNSTKKAGS